MADLTTTTRACPENQTKQTQATLLTLPQELRDIILDFLLLKDKNTITMLPSFTTQLPHTDQVSARPPAICATNRQLRSESLPTFYSLNTFTAQLDNEQDLEIAKTWLSVIGEENVRHLRRLAFCGWTRIPFGHMVSRRWVTVYLDLKAGTMELETSEGKYATDGGVETCIGLGSTMEDLEMAWREVVMKKKEKDGESFDAASLGKLMEGFNSLCTGY